MENTYLENVEKMYILTETHDLLSRKLEENPDMFHTLSLDLYKIEKELKEVTGKEDIASIKEAITKPLIFPSM